MFTAMTRAPALSLATCVLGIALFIPTSSWAISFSLNANILGGKYSGDIFLQVPTQILCFPLRKTSPIMIMAPHSFYRRT